MAKSKEDQLFARVFAVADLHLVQGIDLARLSTALSELSGRDRVVARALAELVGHANPSRRRLGIHACRKIRRFEAPGLREALLGRLADEDPWVRYDAAWAVHEAGYDGKDVRDALGVLAQGVDLPDDRRRLAANPSNADLAARVRARDALDALLAVEATGGVGSCGAHGR